MPERCLLVTAMPATRCDRVGTAYLLDVVVRASGSLGQGRVDNLVVLWPVPAQPKSCRLPTENTFKHCALPVAHLPLDKFL